MIFARSLLICALAGIAVVSQAVPGSVAQGGDTKITALPATAPASAPVAAVDPDQKALELFKPVEQIAKQWIARPEIQRSLVGLEIMDIPSGRVLFSHNGHKRFVSASIAKVFTCACAYDLLGGDYRYKTSFYGYGEIRDSKLNGPLIVIASQDPSFSTNSLNSMVKQLAGRVKAINGSVHVGQVSGGGDFFATEWLIQDWGQDWMPASSDFVIDRNVALMKDLGRGYTLKTAGSDSESLALTRSLLKGPWASAWVTFNKSNNSVTFHRPDGPLQNEPVVANPTDYNTAVVRSVLKNNGIAVGGKDLPASGSPIVLAQDLSPPISEIAKFCLEHSDNLYAQQLLRTIGTLPALNSKLEHASLEDRGLARMTNWLQTKCGVSPSEAILFDGCGLSRKDAVTPHSLNMVLRHMGGTAANSGFLELMKHDYDVSAKSFKYKTGAMDSVRSISGIARTSTGQPIAITAIVNAHTPSVRELRTTLVALVSKIESLGALKLKPAVTKPSVTKQSGRSTQKRSASRRTSSQRTRRTRR
jgi:D-alanyl-D-alanine carboxypeptidase/D-alanyl-D-alanine-endopeptidase (penicillin-binding protein 4)